MKKVMIVGHRQDQAPLVKVLQTAGVIEIAGRNEPGEENDNQGSLAAFRADQIRQELSKVKFVRDLIARSQPPRSGILAGLLPDRFELGRLDFERIGAKIEFETLHDRASALDTERRALEAKIRSLTEDRNALSLWADMDVPFSALESSDKVAIVLGRVSGVGEQDVRAALLKIDELIDLTIVDASLTGVGLVVVFLTHNGRFVDPVLAELGFERAHASWADAPRQEMEKLNLYLTTAEREQGEIKAEIVRLAAFTKDLRVLEDWLKGQQTSNEIQARFTGTATAFALEGWVAAGQADPLAAMLHKESRVVDYSVAEPVPGERVPTLIRNTRLARPFEVITKLYGMPNYHELDPTPLTGLFFTLFFGIALGDAGYGLVLAGFCQWLKRRLLLTSVGRQWFDLFTIGGLASVFVGMLTGSYFGLPKESLPHIARRLMLFDPLTEALLFLLLTLALGAIHVLLGMALEFWNSWSNNHRAAALTRDLTRFSVALAAATVSTIWVIAVVLQKESALTAFLLTLSLSALGWAALLYVLASGDFITRCVGFAADKTQADEKLALALFLILAASLASQAAFKWPLIAAVWLLGMILSGAFRWGMAALGSGLYNLYGLTRFLNDVLSYSRLMALGLATFLIGFVINILAGLVATVTLFGLPVGILLALAIALPLHVANLAINLLSAFVHPLRLQFVEFFSQFYENGGHEFAPFTFETEHLLIKEE